MKTKNEIGPILKMFCWIGLIFSAFIFFPVTIMIFINKFAVMFPDEKFTKEQENELKENLRLARAESMAAGLYYIPNKG